MKNFMKAFAVTMLAASLCACTSTPAGDTSTTDTASTVKTGTNSSYAYLLDTADLEMPDLDLSNADGKLKEILDNGVLTISTSPDWAPGEFVDDEGTVYGSEMMLAKYIADCLGVDLDIETMDFNATLTAVSTSKVELAISGFGWKKDREENFELSNGYSGTSEAACHTLLVPSSTATDYSSLDDFSGKHVLAQSGSLQEMYVEDQIPDADLELITSIDQGILSLASDKADALALPCTSADNYAEQSGGSLASLKGMVEFDLTQYGSKEGQVIAAAKGETSLIGVINQIVDFVNEKGYYTTWYEQAKEQAAALQ